MATNYLKGGDRIKVILERAVANVDKASQVAVGFLEGSIEEDGTSIPMVAAIQNFGAPKVGIPPRPFFSNMIQQNMGNWGGMVATLMERNDYDAVEVLGKMGEEIKGELQVSIKATNEPELSKTTLMLRQMKADDPSLRDRMSYRVVQEARARVAAGKPYKSTGTAAKPLIDTGTMWQSVDYEVS
jgi:hypothetical protein